MISQSIIPRITSIKPIADKKSEAIFKGTTFCKLLRNFSSDVASFFAFKTVLIHQKRPTRPSIDKTENKKKDTDKSEKKVFKSSYSKKKKTKKNILNGIAYVQSTFNNTIISIADTNGNVISWASAGQKGFKGSRKSTPYAAQVAADAAASKALEYGMKTLNVEIKGPGSGRETALRALQAKGFKILSIKDTTPMPHNGTRPPKKRRV